MAKRRITPISIALNLGSFAVLAILSPILITFRLLGVLSEFILPNWLIFFLIITIIINLIALRTNLFWKND